MKSKNVTRQKLISWDQISILCSIINRIYTECPTRYRTRHFFNNFVTNEDIATKSEADLPRCVRKVTTDANYRHTLQTRTTDTNYRHTTDTHYRHTLQTHTTHTYTHTHTTNTHYRHTHYRHTHYRHKLQTHYRHTIQTHTTDTHYRHTLQTRTTDTHYRHIPLHFSHSERTPVQISFQYLHWR